MVNLKQPDIKHFQCVLRL